MSGELNYRDARIDSLKGLSAIPEAQLEKWSYRNGFEEFSSYCERMLKNEEVLPPLAEAVWSMQLSGNIDALAALGDAFNRADKNFKHLNFAEDVTQAEVAPKVAALIEAGDDAARRGAAEELVAIIPE